MLGPAQPAHAKSYGFPRIRIEIDVQPDGSFLVREHRTYDFRGSFRRAFIEIDRGSYEIAEPGVSERGTPLRPGRAGDETSGTFLFTRHQTFDEIRWFYDAEDERRTFTISYRIQRGIIAFADVAEFHWHFIGSRWDVAGENVTALVRLPPGAAREQLRAWGHGPLEGRVVRVNGSTVRWTVGRLPPRTPLIGRLVFPTSLVPSAPRSTVPRLPAILAEEREAAKRANVARRSTRSWNVGSAGASLASLLLFLFLFLRYGREPPAVGMVLGVRVGRRLREPPAEYPVAVVGYLMRFGTVKPLDVTATVMDLARRGYLKITEATVERGWVFTRVERTYSIEVQQREGSDLAPHEQQVIALLDEAGTFGSVSDADLREWGRSNPGRMQEWFSAFRTSVTAAGTDIGLVEERGMIVALNLVAAAVLVILGVVTLVREVGGVAVPFLLGVLAIAGAVAGRRIRALALAFGVVGGLLTAGIGAGFGLWTAPGGLIAVVVGVAQAGLTPLLRRRSFLGAGQYRAWKAFARFLKEFASIREARPPAVALWERYLVYAIPLGVAPAVARALEVHAPEIARDGFSWYAAGGGMLSAPGPSFDGFATSFTASAQAAFATPASSGSGYGGGFSGGSGGGAGGGGGGGAS